MTDPFIFSIVDKMKEMLSAAKDDSMVRDIMRGRTSFSEQEVGGLKTRYFVNHQGELLAFRPQQQALFLHELSLFFDEKTGHGRTLGTVARTFLPHEDGSFGSDAYQEFYRFAFRFAELSTGEHVEAVQLRQRRLLADGTREPVSFAPVSIDEIIAARNSQQKFAEFSSRFMIDPTTPEKLDEMLLAAFKNEFARAGFTFDGSILNNRMQGKTTHAGVPPLNVAMDLSSTATGQLEISSEEIGAEPSAEHKPVFIKPGEIELLGRAAQTESRDRQRTTVKVPIVAPSEYAADALYAGAPEAAQTPQAPFTPSQRPLLQDAGSAPPLGSRSGLASVTPSYESIEEGRVLFRSPGFAPNIIGAKKKRGRRMSYGGSQQTAENVATQKQEQSAQQQPAASQAPSQTPSQAPSQAPQQAPRRHQEEQKKSTQNTGGGFKKKLIAGAIGGSAALGAPLGWGFFDTFFFS